MTTATTEQPVRIGQLVPAVMKDIERRVMQAQGGEKLLAMKADVDRWMPPVIGSARSKIAGKALESVYSPYRFRGEGEPEYGGAYDDWGLVRACIGAAIDDEPCAVWRDEPGYTVLTGSATMVMMSWGGRRITARQAEPGDLLLFQMNDQGGMHPAVMTAPGKYLPAALFNAGRAPEPTMVHAFWGRSVVESHVSADWINRLHSVWRISEPGGRASESDETPRQMVARMAADLSGVAADVREIADMLSPQGND